MKRIAVVVEGALDVCSPDVADLHDELPAVYPPEVEVVPNIQRVWLELCSEILRRYDDRTPTAVQANHLQQELNALIMAHTRVGH
jgi:hypothetical protein